MTPSITSGMITWAWNTVQVGRIQGSNHNAYDVAAFLLAAADKEGFAGAVARIKGTPEYQKAITAAEAFTWDDPVDLEEYMARLRPKPRTGLGRSDVRIIKGRIKRVQKDPPVESPDLIASVTAAIRNQAGSWVDFMPEARAAVLAVADWLDTQRVWDASAAKRLRDEVTPKSDEPDHEVGRAWKDAEGRTVVTAVNPGYYWVQGRQLHEVVGWGALSHPLTLLVPVDTP